jgi:hypothetical protein
MISKLHGSQKKSKEYVLKGSGLAEMNAKVTVPSTDTGRRYTKIVSNDE